MANERRDPFLDRMDEVYRLQRLQIRGQLVMVLGFCVLTLVAMIGLAVEASGVGKAAVAAIELLFAR